MTPRCGQVLRRLERPGRPVFDDPVCGRPAGHTGQHDSVPAIRRRRYTRRVPSGSPEIAVAIWEARRKAGMSQRRLAAVLGVTQTAVRHYEHADRTPSAATWVQLELALGPLGVVRDRPAEAGDDGQRQGEAA